MEDEESSEMEIDEEKAEINEEEGEDDDSEGDEEDAGDAAHATPIIENPFLDSFYGLSSENAKERAKAAQVMLQHCLLRDTSNAEDAAYAFKRLLNGVCSGRSSARQGNASALASFLKLAFHLNKMEDVRSQDMNDQDKDSSLFFYVRERLITATSPEKITGKRKGAEERDYYFGRLFGILAIVRSGILINYESSGQSIDGMSDVATSLGSDLADLFWHKRWMREPAAHGITALLKLFYDAKGRDSMSEVASRIVNNVVTSRLLAKGSNGGKLPTDESFVASLCAEQLGIAIFIQSQSKGTDQDFGFPLNQPILSEQSVPLIAQALSETSSVIQPRTHFVWDTIWDILSTPQKDSKKKTQKGVTVRHLREDHLQGGGEARAVLIMILRHTVASKLLGIENEEGDAVGKMTHERGALAMTIVKVLGGVPYVSSISGPTQLILDSQTLEDGIMTPEIVRAIFIDIIAAGSEKKKTSHLLKPLAVNVLNGISTSVSQTSTAEGPSRQFAVARSLLKADIRFDAKTKTSTVAEILGFMKPIQKGQVESTFSNWTQFFDHLQNTILSLSKDVSEDSSSAHVTGHVEMLYTSVKMILRTEVEDQEEKESLQQKQFTVAEQILRFFMTAAFFNCEGIVHGAQKKKKGKKNADESPILAVALAVKEPYTHGCGIVHNTRSVLSYRFFSLLADFCGLASHQVATDTTSKTTKDSKFLSILSGLCDSWKSLEGLGAKRFAEPGDDEDEDAVDPNGVLSQMDQLLKDVNQASATPLSESRKRCITGISVLSYSLFLHRLSCGTDGKESEDPDADDNNDEEAICDAMDNLKDIASDFIQQPDDQNPLLGLAETCVNLLSSPLGSGNMGRAASPKLIREAVKFSWLGGLRLSSLLIADGQTMFNADVVDTLLDGIGAGSWKNESENDDDEDMDQDEDVSDDSNSASDSEDEDNVFQKAGALMVDESDEEQMSTENDGESESDVELDATNLKSLLEEDSDADVDENVLEHHEGADAALAKLIKLKQEARKAGQQAKEKIELGHQLRCTLLVELLFTRPDAWKELFQPDVILRFVAPMLQQRKYVEKSMSKVIESGSRTTQGEKRSLLDRLTTLLQQKICKLRLATLSSTSTPSETAISNLVATIISELKRAGSKDQMSCCTSSLVLVLRSTTDAKVLMGGASKLVESVDEWSQKKTTKLQSLLFDDLIAQVPLVSQAVLMTPLEKALTTARSPFLKAETFRLLASLFAAPASTESSELGEIATKNLESVAESFLSSASAALADEEMRKSKRVKSILKALEKFLDKMPTTVSTTACSLLKKIKDGIATLAESESQGVQSSCSKLIATIEVKVAELEVAASTPQKMVTGGSNVGSSKSKKSSKKKKKKRR